MDGKMTMQEYLALKAVSAGVLRTLIEECPAAAWHYSAFNPEPAPADDTDASDAGTIIHSIILEGGAGSIAVFDPAEYPNLKGGGTATGWTNKAIKEARDTARSIGKIPILKEDFAGVVAASTSAQRFIESLKDTEPAVWAAFQPDGGVSEETITFDCDGVPCKMRPDRRSTDSRLLIDVKTTKTSAEPDRWGRSQLYGQGYDLSAAFYRLGIIGLRGVVPAYKFLVVQQEPPYLCSLCECDPQGIELAARKVEFALREWARCVKSGFFPGYPNRTAYISPPGWAEAVWLEREIAEPML